MKKFIFILMLLLLCVSVSAKIKTEDFILNYGETMNLDFEEGGKFNVRAYENTQIDFQIEGKGEGSIIIDEISRGKIKIRVKRRAEKFIEYDAPLGEKIKIDIAEGPGPDLIVEPRVVHYEDDKTKRNIVLYFNAFSKIIMGAPPGEKIEKAEENKTEEVKSVSAPEEPKKSNKWIIIIAVIIVVILLYFKFFKDDDSKEEEHHKKEENTEEHKITHEEHSEKEETVEEEHKTKKKKK